MSASSARPDGRLGGGGTTAAPLETLRAEREAILEATGLVSVALGSDGDTIVDVSDGAVRLLGRGREALVGLPFSYLCRTSPERSGDAVATSVFSLRGGSGGVIALHSWGVVRVGRRSVLLMSRSPPAETGAVPSPGPGEGAERVATLVSAPDFPGLVGRSTAIRDVCRLIGKVAPTDSTVLVSGESGTGKEVVATTIHAHSPRRNGPMVKVNCACLSEALLESELFGHVKGAFTGATRDRNGRFAEADGGTILLDEIGSMSLSGQTRLLRVLQEREFEPVGSSATRKVDVRVVATTNVDLERAVEEGAFRQDLYFRLGVVRICLPPLRERMEDVPLLAHDALLRFARRMGRGVRAFRPGAMQALLDHDWPGNVRELENVVEHALVVEDGPEVTRASLPLPEAGLPDEGPGRAVPDRPAQPLGLRRQLEILEKQIVLQALRRARWVRKDAARHLGIDPRNLSYFLRKHRISRRDRSPADAH